MPSGSDTGIWIPLKVLEDDRLNAADKIILSEIARLRRMPDLAHRVQNYEPQPDPAQEKLRELEIRELEAKIMLQEAEALERKTQAELNQAKAKEALSRADTMDLDFVERDTGTKQARDLEKIERQAEANQDMKVTEAILGQRNPSNGPGDKPDTSPTPENIGTAVRFNAATRGTNR